MHEEQRRIAIVTGSASGIGRAVVERLRRDGWRVVGIDLAGDATPTPADGQTVVGDAPRVANAQTVVGDAADPDVLQVALAAAGRTLNGLVCAAGLPPNGPWDDRDHWANVLRVDLTAPYEALRAALPALRQTGGSAVLIGSIVGGAEGSERSPAYAAAKAGVEGLARSFAVIGGPDGVRVNVVAPGAIDTPFDPPLLPPDQRPDVPLGRMGRAAEIADVVAFLLSEEAAYVTGAVWRVDGGRTIQPGATAIRQAEAPATPPDPV